MEKRSAVHECNSAGYLEWGRERLDLCCGPGLRSAGSFGQALQPPSTDRRWARVLKSRVTKHAIFSSQQPSRRKATASRRSVTAPFSYMFSLVDACHFNPVAYCSRKSGRLSDLTHAITVMRTSPRDARGGFLDRYVQHLPI